MLKVYEFRLEYGCCSVVDGAFVADDFVVNSVIGQTVTIKFWSGNEVTFVLANEHLTIKSEDADFIAKYASIFEEFYPNDFTIYGENPLHWIPSLYKEET